MQIFDTQQVVKQLARLAHLARHILHGMETMVRNPFVPALPAEQGTGGGGTMADGSAASAIRNLGERIY